MRKLQRMPDEVTEGIRRELRTAALELAAEMRARAPVSAVPRHPEHVRDLIEAKLSRDGLRARVGVFGTGTVASEVLFTFTRAGKKHTIRKRDDFYARFLEFGTKKMTKRPFVYPAWMSMKVQVLGNIRDAVRKAVDAAANGPAPDA